MDHHLNKYFRVSFLTLLIFIALHMTGQDIIIEEVYYNPTAGVSKKIALRNTSLSAKNISNWCLCNFPSYRTIGTASAFNILQGDPSNLGPNELLIIELTGNGFVFDNTSELGLYHTNGCFGFTTASNMEDYVAWGASGTRAPVAVNAGLWTANSAFVTSAPSGSVLVFDGMNTGPGNISSPNDFSNQPTGTLPLKLEHFTARLNQKENEVILNWKTFNEIIIDHFIIRKSADGKDFKKLSEVLAHSNANYSFTDDRVETENELYYQLEIVESNGSSYFSHVVNIKIPVQKNTFTLFPNPALNSESIILKTDTRIEKHNWKLKIFDSLGRLHFIEDFNSLQKTGNQITIPRFSSERGFYIIKLFKNGTVQQLLPLVLL